MKSHLLIAFTSLSISGLLHAAEENVYQAVSPNKELVLSLQVEDTLSLSVSYKGEIVLLPSSIGLSLSDGRVLGSNPKVVDSIETRSNEIIRSVVAQKRSVIEDRFNQTTVRLADSLSVVLRAYDDGVAYRFAIDLGGEVEIADETMQLRFPPGTRSFFPEEESFISHNERLYLDLALEDLDATRFCSLPVMLDTPSKAKILFTEADLYEYPAMYLKGGDGALLEGMFPKYVLESRPNAENGPDRNELIVREGDFIAKSKGTRELPWRAFAISDNDGDFLESDLVFKLSRPLEIEDPSWIKPGKVTWDWYNANNIFGVDFESGINNDTYKYYIDTAAQFGVEYVILDEGWSKTTLNVFEPNPDIDVPELVAYGKERGVGIILWSLWRPFWDDKDALFDLYEKWGVKGVKIDFMQRSDQAMVDYYTDVVKAAAKRKMIVDFHGAFKPAGLRRAYPNVISYEGVKGSENNKWSADVTPRHNVTIPFIRMAVGPMDYTPGAMVNANPGNFRISHFRPMSLGTRSHEAAKYIVFESALQMICENPTILRREAESTSFITSIPTTWDDTKALDCVIGEQIVVARRKGEDWYIAAMSNEDARTIEIDLSFLPEGEYAADIMQDGANSHNYAEDYKRIEKSLSSGEKIEINLAPGGGWAAILKKK